MKRIECSAYLRAVRADDVPESVIGMLEFQFLTCQNELAEVVERVGEEFQFREVLPGDPDPDAVTELRQKLESEYSRIMAERDKSAIALDVRFLQGQLTGLRFVLAALEERE